MSDGYGRSTEDFDIDRKSSVNLKVETRERDQGHFPVNECLKVVSLIPFFLLASVSGLQGCVSTDSQGLQRSAPPNEVATVSKDMATIENMMRWPLEGPAGTDKVIAGLRQIATFEEVEPSQFFSDGPIELVDGYVLSFSDFHLRGKSIDIGVEQNPCFSTELAMAITKATASPVTRDAHGIDRGKFYVVERNGVTVSFTTTPLTYECVNSIYVDPAYRTQDK